MSWVEGLINLSRSRGAGIRPWAITVGLFSASVALRLALEPALEGMKFLTFYPSIALATLICGLRQGVAVLILSTLASWYLLFEPFYSFAVKDAKTTGALIGFILVGGFILLLVAALRETVRRLEIAKIAQATLFSELQHRVANNLQLVVALLRQAQRDLRNPVLAAEALHDAEERIMAMSQLHRRLNDGTAFIDGFEPLLEEVLANAFSKLPVTYRIRLDAAPDLSIDQMTAATLLVNEAALNSAKHVFSKGLGTCFEVCLSRDETGFVDLTVNDDGPGVGAEVVDARARSLGMGIMESFANQLGGNLEIDDKGGMSLRVRFAS
jgi:two-component sensor histidine kinase